MFRNSLFLLLIALFFLSCAKQDTQPNFVFILVDDLGWADVHCNNPNTFYETPNIDKLAENGVRFTNAYSANPVCSPSRAAIMTGKHPNRVNITDWIPGDDPKTKPLLGTVDRNELALEETTIAEKLKEKGYTSAAIGKWHLGSEGFYPEDQGFDVNIGGYHMGHPPGGYYSPYKNPKLPDGPEGEYLTDRLTDESIRFITANKDHPFFLYLAFYTVHTPIQAAKNYLAKYEQKKDSLASYESAFRNEGDGFTKLNQENAAYASMVNAMDNNVGRVLTALKELGIDKNTWIIFTSDNGGLSTLHTQNAPTSNEPLRAGKGWCYEGGIRVPLIISGPAVKKPGRTNDTPTIGMDFFTTILHLAEIEHDENDGQNLTPLLTGVDSVTRDELFWHYPHYHTSAWKPGSAIRKGDWKLIYYYEDERTELYNLATDVKETTDLAQEYPEKASELKTILDTKLKESGAYFPQPNPDFNPMN